MSEEDQRYSRVEVLDRTGEPFGNLEPIVSVKVPGVPRNHHVFLIEAQPDWNVQYACSLAGFRAWQLSQAKLTETREEEKTKCPLCGGEGTNVHFVERANVAINIRRCERCGGKGYLEGEELGHKPSAPE